MPDRRMKEKGKRENEEKIVTDLEQHTTKHILQHKVEQRHTISTSAHTHSTQSRNHQRNQTGDPVDHLRRVALPRRQELEVMCQALHAQILQCIQVQPARVRNTIFFHHTEG